MRPAKMTHIVLSLRKWSYRIMYIFGQVVYKTYKHCTAQQLTVSCSVPHFCSNPSIIFRIAILLIYYTRKMDIFKCPICYESVGSVDAIVTSSYCNHIICKSCMTLMLTHEIQNLRRIDFQCPKMDCIGPIHPKTI